MAPTMRCSRLARRAALATLVALLLAACGTDDSDADADAEPDPPEFAESEPESGWTRYLDLVFDEVEVTRNVRFAEVANGDRIETLEMDVFVPAGDTATDRPILIAAFGGGFVGGERGSVEELAIDFARRGYVTATIDYRLIPDREPSDADELVTAALHASHDGFAAVRFLRNDAARWGVRPDAAFVGGVSAGGVLASITAIADPDDAARAGGVVRAFYDAHGGVYGVGDDDIAAERSRVQGAINLSGAVLDLGTIDADDGVMFSAHDEFDPIVPCGTDRQGDSAVDLTVSGSCAMADRLDEVGVPNALFLQEGSADHVGFDDSAREQIYAEAAALFFEHVLDG